MPIIYIEGRVTLKTFTEKCFENGLDPDKVVFLFPGNPTHHGANNNLYSVKSGGGLAIPAGELGKAGLPVLSLPTTGIHLNWEGDPKQKNMVQKAILDLYRAIGAGYTLMLPIRNRPPAGRLQYFKEGLQGIADKEPSFWGQNNTTVNETLASYYLQHLNRLTTFDPNAPQFAKDEESTLLREALMSGQTMRNDDPWLQSHFRAASPIRKPLVDLSDVPSNHPIDQTPGAQRSRNPFVEGAKILKPVNKPQQRARDLNIPQFAVVISDLRLKTTELIAKGTPGNSAYNPKYKKVAGYANSLITTLTNAHTDFLNAEETSETKRLFKETCQDAIANARDSFSEHRSAWSQISPIFKAILGVLAAITIIPALAVQGLSSHGYVKTFFGNPPTDASEKLHDFEQRFHKIY